MTRSSPIVAAIRPALAAALVAGLAALATSPAQAAPKKTALECSDDYVECTEYCDKFEKPYGSPNHNTCMTACQYTYDKCTDPTGQRPTRINTGQFLPGASPGVYDTGSAQPLLQSPLPTKKIQ